MGNKKKLFVLREVSHIKWIGTDHLGVTLKETLGVICRARFGSDRL